METTELLARLTQDLEPTKKAPSLAMRIGGWIVSMMLFAVVTVLVLGTRADIHSIMFTPRFIVESVAILIAGITAGVLALILSSPGKRTRESILTALGASVVWLISIGIAFFLQLPDSPLSDGLNSMGLMCSKKIIVLSVIPALLLTALLRLGTAIAGRIAGTFLLISSGLIGMFLLQMRCSMDHTVHLMLYHLLPVVALGVLGWCLGGYLCGFEARLKKKKEEILGTSD